MSNSEAAALTVGWIGCGHMGAPLAERLAKAGLDVAAWNRTRSKADALAPSGIKVVDEPAQLATRDIVFTMVTSSDDLEAVTARLLEHTPPAPRFLIDCSTVSVASSARVRELAAGCGVQYLAAPVSGNGRVAAAGLMSLAVSGSPDAFAAVQPVLALLGEHVSYVGEGELSRIAKICHNLLLGVVAQTLTEVTVLAQKAGMSRADFLDFINHSVLGSLFTRYKSPALVHLDFSPTFTPVLLQKDFDLGMTAARALGVPMAVVAAAREPVQSAVARGRTEEDFAVLLELQAEASGLALSPEDVPVDDGLGGPA